MRKMVCDIRFRFMGAKEIAEGLRKKIVKDMGL
jgi:hypothetical protein